jgi:hypothetical protein
MDLIQLFVDPIVGQVLDLEQLTAARSFDVMLPRGASVRGLSARAQTGAGS